MTRLAPDPATDDFLWRNLKDLPAFRGLLRAVEARFYPARTLPAQVLDLGSGDAPFASVAFDRPLDVGVDPWTPPLREARRLRPAVYRGLAQAAGAALPFPDGHFASAVSNSVLEHIPDLDPALTVEIMDLLCDVNARGTTVVVATHDASLIERYQKRTLRLERGTLVAEERGAKAALLMVQSQ